MSEWVGERRGEDKKLAELAFKKEEGRGRKRKIERKKERKKERNKERNKQRKKER